MKCAGGICRIAAPVDDEVRSILHFAQRTRDLATQLGGYLSGAVSKRGVAVDHTSDQFGQRHRLALGLACDIAEAVHQRHVGLVQEVGRRFEAASTVAGFPSISASGYRCSAV